MKKLFFYKKKNKFSIFIYLILALIFSYFLMNLINFNNKTFIQIPEFTDSYYKIPKDTLETLPWGEKYIGQTQKWFAFKFMGTDSEINVGTDNPDGGSEGLFRINFISESLKFSV